MWRQKRRTVVRIKNIIIRFVQIESNLVLPLDLFFKFPRAISIDRAAEAKSCLERSQKVSKMRSLRLFHSINRSVA